MSQVKLILLEGVHNLGEVGDLVSVKPGYARNYLLPQRKALLATESRVRELEHHKRVVAERAAKEMQDLEAARKKLEGLKLETSARAGDEGKLFGSIGTLDIAEAATDAGVPIEISGSCSSTGLVTSISAAEASVETAKAPRARSPSARFITMGEKNGMVHFASPPRVRRRSCRVTIFRPDIRRTS